VTTKPESSNNPLLIVQVILVGMLLVVLIVGPILERERPAVAPTPDIAAINTAAILTAWAPVTLTAAAAWTPIPQDTPTPFPTEIPPPTATQLPQPIIMTGRGDSVIYPEKWDGPAVAHITYHGSGFFFVWNHDPSGQRQDLLADRFGDYDGTSLIDFATGRTLRFEVRAAEAWRIELLPLASARQEAVPNRIQGMGDEVFLLQPLGTPDLLTMDASGATGHFSVWVYGAARTLLIDAIAPYAGTVALPADTTTIAVKANGPWSLDITTR
jgi:hypothetical protein